MQAGAQGHTNIDSAEFTRRQTVNARRKQLGKTPKYPMPKTEGTKQVKTTIGRHRGETSGGGNRSGKGAGAKGTKTTGKNLVKNRHAICALLSIPEGVSIEENTDVLRSSDFIFREWVFVKYR